MTFLNPLYLLALAAAAIPIILHLLNLRKSKIVEFSTLTFLRELQRSKIRKLKIKQWILLALRTLVVVFLVLAFTRPAVRSTLGFLPGTRAKSSVVIILDDSFSMLASDDGGQLFKQAKEKAAALLDLLNSGDEVALIRMSQVMMENRQFTAAISAVRRELETAQPSFRHVSMTDAMTAASVLLDKSHNINKEIFVLSDDQRSHFIREKRAGAGSLFPPDVKFYYFPLGKEHTSNTAVTDIRVVSSLFEKDKPIDMAATILNDAPSPIEGGIISVFLNGERVMQKSIEVQAGARKEIQFSVVPKSGGFLEGFVELEDDAIAEDNRRYFALYVPENLHILLVPAGTQEATIVRLALQPSVQENGVPRFIVDPLDKSNISSVNLARYDVVALLGASFVSSSLAQRLAQYVENGGAVLLFPDADGNLSSFTGTLLPALGIPSPNGINGSPGSKSSYSLFGKIDFDHPLFKSVFRSDNPAKKPEIVSPRLFCTVRLKGSESSEPVVSTSGGDAFLLDHAKEKGRVLVFGVSPSLQWSDFPLKGIFAPILNRAMYYLASREDYIQTGIIGAPFDIVLPSKAEQSAAFEVKSPGGNTTRIIPKTFPSGYHFSINDLEKPGVYDLSGGGKTLRKLPVNIDASESDMTRVTSKERDGYYASLGIRHVNTFRRDTNISQAIAQIRFGVELWKYMIALALLCAIAEMLVARDVKKSQSELPV